MPESAIHYPPPALSRWSLTWRYALAGGNWALAALVVVLVRSNVGWLGGIFATDGTPRPPLGLAVVDIGLGAVALYLIRFRRRRPLMTLLALALIDALSSSSDMVLAWALVSLATHRRWRTLVPGMLAYAAATVVQALISSGPGLGGGEGIAMAVVVLVWTAALVSLGLFVGARRDLIAALRERADAAEREQELRVLQGQADERNRIAREMHDVLAHRLSLVSMHAGVLAFRDDLSAEETREIARVIQENAHTSLTELRGVLHSLRQDAPTPAEGDNPPAEIDKPQPREFSVDDLVADARAGGMRLDFTNAMAHAELLPSTTARHAYRIVQEALTNARKHAPGVRVHLRVEGAPGRGLTITARNPKKLRVDNEVPGSGVGLVGLRERVNIMGGRMAVRQDESAFELEVWLPW